MMNIYVGNLDYGVTDEQLKAMFEEHGAVDSAKIIMDRFTQRSRGFGFVEMADDDQAQAAINELNGKEINGRSLVVNEARPRNQRDNRGGGGGGRRRGGFGGGGGRGRF